MNIPNVEQDYGPTLEVSKWVHEEKYRGQGETFKDAMTRVAEALKDSESHFNNFRTILYNQRFLPAGRVQSAMGAPRRVTPYNCFVSTTIEDSMDGIMDAARRAAETMRLGGGIGYDFSTLRPRGAMIKSLESKSYPDLNPNFHLSDILTFPEKFKLCMVSANSAELYPLLYVKL